LKLRDGVAEASADATQLEFRADGGAGVYRVEARVGGKPWLFSNHIYVRLAR
jgi:hypothetical protein